MSKPPFRAIVRFDRQAKRDNEIDLVKGTDIRQVRDSAYKDWLIGVDDNGLEGLFPRNHVELLADYSLESVLDKAVDIYRPDQAEESQAVSTLAAAANTESKPDSLQQSESNYIQHNVQNNTASVQHTHFHGTVKVDISTGSHTNATNYTSSTNLIDYSNTATLSDSSHKTLSTTTSTITSSAGSTRLWATSTGKVFRLLLSLGILPSWLVRPLSWLVVAAFPSLLVYFIYIFASMTMVSAITSIISPSLTRIPSWVGSAATGFWAILPFTSVSTNAVTNVKWPVGGGVIDDGAISEVNAGLYQQDNWLVQNSGSHMLDIVMLQEILAGAKTYFAILEKGLDPNLYDLTSISHHLDTASASAKPTVEAHQDLIDAITHLVETDRAQRRPLLQMIKRTNTTLYAAQRLEQQQEELDRRFWDLQLRICAPLRFPSMLGCPEAPPPLPVITVRRILADRIAAWRYVLQNAVARRLHLQERHKFLKGHSESKFQEFPASTCKAYSLAQELLDDQNTGHGEGPSSDGDSGMGSMGGKGQEAMDRMSSSYEVMNQGQRETLHHLVAKSQLGCSWGHGFWRWRAQKAASINDEIQWLNDALKKLDYERLAVLGEGHDGVEHGVQGILAVEPGDDEVQTMENMIKNQGEQWASVQRSYWETLY